MKYIGTLNMLVYIILFVTYSKHTFIILKINNLETYPLIKQFQHCGISRSNLLIGCNLAHVVMIYNPGKEFVDF